MMSASEDGEGGHGKADIVLEVPTNRFQLRTRVEGVKKSKKIVDVIYGCSFLRPLERHKSKTMDGRGRNEQRKDGMPESQLLKEPSNQGARGSRSRVGVQETGALSLG